jgi:hypothetical protein
VEQNQPVAEISVEQRSGDTVADSSRRLLPNKDADSGVVASLVIEPAYFPLDLGPDETHYITFFLTEVKSVMPYFECFPRMVSEIFNRAATDQALLRTILSVSHLIADSRMGRSLVPAFQHHQEALGALQRSISTTDVTEAVAISVTMLAWLNICQPNPSAASQHLHGAYLIFKEIRRRHIGGTAPTPLLMQIWRVAIRLDLLGAILFFPRKPLFSPVPAGQDDVHRHWIRLSTPNEDTAEWTLASFALDDLLHRSCHIASVVRQLRQSDNANAEPQIERLTSSLLAEHDQWYQRAIVQQAEKFEREANSNADQYPPLISASQFLDHPPLRLYSSFYGNMLNSWRAIYIYIDLILHPHIGPGDKSSTRSQRAVEICRTYASLVKAVDIFPSGKIWTMYLAGVALGGVGRSPRETYWVYKFVLAELKQFFPLNVEALVCAYSVVITYG